MRIKQLLKSKNKSFLMQALCVVASGMMIASASAQTTVTIGAGTTTTTNTPITSCWNYSYSQQIYTAADMVAAGYIGGGIISKIRFFYASGNYGSSTDWTLYIGGTAKSSFNSNSDWEAIGNLTNSFSGTVTFPAVGNWLEITLTTPFVWDGISNIIVGVDENQPAYDCSVNWRKSDLGSNRSIYFYSDGTNPNPASPPSANSRANYVPNIQFDIVPLDDCIGAPIAANIISSAGSVFCEGDDFELTVDDSYLFTGITYQWQVFNGVDYDDILNDTNIVSSLNATSTTNYQLVVGCSLTGDETILAPFAVTVNAAPTVLVDIASTSICPGDAATITASGATTYAWSPATGLNNSNSAVVDANPTSTTTYTVTGADAIGCTNTATVSVIPNSAVKAEVVINPSEICTPGSAVSAAIGGSLPVNSTGGDWNYRFLEADGITEAQTWSTNDVFNFIPTADSVYKFYYQLRNSACLGDLDSVSFNFIVGFGGDVTTVDYDCNNLGGSVILSNVFGQADIQELYSNDFSLGADLSALTFTGAAAVTNGRAVITPSATGLDGSMMITIPGFQAGSNNSMNVSFDLSTDLPIDNYGTGGADGITYSFGNDANSSATGNNVNGKGSKLRLSFDTAGNTNENNNLPGVYLVYGWTAGNAFGPASVQTLAYSSDITWKGGTDVPVNFVIDAAGKASVTVGGVVIFDNIQLPNDYITADVSAWTHLFSAATGGDGERHAIANLEINAGALVYGLSQGAPTNVPTVWQTSATFAGLAPGTYNVWLAKDETAACGKNIETIEIINTDPVVNLGNDTTICAGSTITLDAENIGSTYVWNNNTATTQTIDVTTTGSYAAYVTAANGCTALGTIYVDVIDAPTATGITMQGNWQSYSFTVANPVNGETYDWSFGDGSTLTNASASVSHVYWTEGTMNVSVTISNDCGTVVITDQFDVANVAGISSVEMEGLSIYPNPTSSELTISLENASESFVTISSVTGATIVNEIKFNSLTKINVENWETGVYFVKVSNNGSSTTQRIIVQ